MNKGAYGIHKYLKQEIKSYIMSQYFGKSPLLLEALDNKLDEENILYKKPYIEASPAYKIAKEGIGGTFLQEWKKEFFDAMVRDGLGVFKTPYCHQIEALTETEKGKDILVSTGTGSGKTECFMWPMISKIIGEAHDHADTWNMRGIRVLIMYPLNALVSDQVGRLRLMMGDSEGKFENDFGYICGSECRRPQFGMYTGRTPYAGRHSVKSQDVELAGTLKTLALQKNTEEYYKELLKQGKIPAKKNLEGFIENLKQGQHITDDKDAEMITRFEMQKNVPDIMITNYSMLEYMLFRPREAKMWDDTKKWLHSAKENKLLFVIDEAHMYRGASGGEVALLIRRLMERLDITRNKIQFILTTASFPTKQKEDREAVYKFAGDLTAGNSDTDFTWVKGQREVICENTNRDIPLEIINTFTPSDFEGYNDKKLEKLKTFFTLVDQKIYQWSTYEEASYWLYDNMLRYRPFKVMIEKCREKTYSLDELADIIFVNENHQKALEGTSVLLSIAPLAKSKKGSVLFPARMHMLFRGIKGVFACVNPNCSHGHKKDGIELGELFIQDGYMSCPYCGSRVYELYNDRRCGTLFFKGYVQGDEFYEEDNVYLWRYAGKTYEDKTKEIHLYIPPKNYLVPKELINKILPCYLDIRSGYLHKKDDSKQGEKEFIKLYYSTLEVNQHPEWITFPTCPHCLHRLSTMRLTAFTTRGNQAFYNLIKAQFMSIPPVSGKLEMKEKFPNAGRKVLLFSDSRQRAAKLARDMSKASDIQAARQLAAIGLSLMDENSKETEYSMEKFYSFMCLAASQKNVMLFGNREGRDDFKNNCEQISKIYARNQKKNKPLNAKSKISNAPEFIVEDLLKMFCGGYNTLLDAAFCWIEPVEEEMENIVCAFEEKDIEIEEDAIMEVFNAWILYVSDKATALGHTISDNIRRQVRKEYFGYGLEDNWKFPEKIQKIMGWKNNSSEMRVWMDIFEESFLSRGNEFSNKLYVDLDQVKLKYDPDHIWYKCEQCSEITPFKLKKHCPSCGSKNIHKMNKEDYQAIDFWRRPLENAINGDSIRVINTEEHTAQLSYKDQRDSMWSKTEEYETRFQDIIRDDQMPVDILSSTTTMEVGIDIGSLVAIGLRNIPPKRENYQQRAGRAGRRGSSLSTILTFCEDGPHDTLYFNNPESMLRGEPRTPWIDIMSEKLLQRHLAMIAFRNFLDGRDSSLDEMEAEHFLMNHMEEFNEYLKTFKAHKEEILLPENTSFDYKMFQKTLINCLKELVQKLQKHPELFGDGRANNKSLLDVLYEEGIIPTYSFPKNVVSVNIHDKGKLKYQVNRGLDLAIGEYAPGRAIVVDKTTYQIGGIYSEGSEKNQGSYMNPARRYIEDPNYLKNIIYCKECGWFGLLTDSDKSCPFCGNPKLSVDKEMLIPWGFAPKNDASIEIAQLDETYTSVLPPVYSTLPERDEMQSIDNVKNIKMAARTNQRIIMLNKGKDGKGFLVCQDCGAAVPGDNEEDIANLRRPYTIKSKTPCKHTNLINVNMGYDFITDMLVLTFELHQEKICNPFEEKTWSYRAAQSLAEGLRLVICHILDVEFTELITGYRMRYSHRIPVIDIYVYDNLSSGAGYAVGIKKYITRILEETEEYLSSCTCQSACHDCLKHYQNQYYYNLLDRFAALDLLRWGFRGELPYELDLNRQRELLAPIKNILEERDCIFKEKDETMYVECQGVRKAIHIYPAMCVRRHQRNTISISDMDLKYSMPRVVRTIYKHMKTDFR